MASSGPKGEDVKVVSNADLVNGGSNGASKNATLASNNDTNANGKEKKHPVPRRKREPKHRDPQEIKALREEIAAKLGLDGQELSKSQRKYLIRKAERERETANKNEPCKEAQKAKNDNAHEVPPLADNVQLHVYGLGSDGSVPILGKDKYLGGVLQPRTNAVYCVPGNARRVLKIADGGEPSYLETPQEYLEEFSNQFKWLRGACAGEWCYGIPSWADRVLCISERDEIVLRPIEWHDEGCTKEGTTWKWHGAVVTRKKHVIAVPCNANCVLKIDFETGRVRTFGDIDVVSKDGSKWYGGILGEDDCVYCMPQNADCVLKICPNTEQVWRIYGDAPEHRFAPNMWSWHGGVFSAKDGCVYALPNHDHRVIRVDPRGNAGRGKLTLFGNVPAPRHRPDGKYKYFGGVQCGNTGDIYCVPGDADHVLKIVPPERRDAQGQKREGEFEDEARLELLTAASFDTGQPANPHSVAMDQNKWQNGFWSKQDQCVYCIPLKAQRILKIHTRPDRRDRVELLGPENTIVGELPTTAKRRAECTNTMEGRNPLVGNNKWEGGVMDVHGRMYCMPMHYNFILCMLPEQA